MVTSPEDFPTHSIMTLCQQRRQLTPNKVDMEISEVFGLSKEPEEKNSQFFEIKTDFNPLVTQLGNELTV